MASPALLGALAAALLSEAAPSAPAAADPMTALKAAAARAAENADARFAFTLDYTDLAESEATYRVRFDPRLPKGARWTPLDPPLEALSDKQRKSLEALQADNEPDDSFVYDRLAAMSDGLALVSESPEKAVFEAPLEGPDVPKDAARALVMKVTLDRIEGHVEAIEVRSQKSFKPSPAAVVRSMRETTLYAPDAESGLALMTEAQSVVEGEAMFRPFRQNVRTVYSDIERVEAEPFED